MLNLDNINSPETWDSPLVLTSPRSVAACRLVGVKPVDLLPKDLLELAETVGTGQLDKLTDLRNFLEHRRLTKLEHCRAIRRYLISQHAVDELHLFATHNCSMDLGTSLVADLSLFPPQDGNIPGLRSNRVSVSLRQQEDEFSARKSKLDSENRDLAERRKSLLAATDFSVQPCSREPPLSDGPVEVVDCFSRTNHSQKSFQEDLCLSTRRAPKQPIRQKRYSRRSETPLSDKIGSSSDRDCPGPIASVPPSPTLPSYGRTSHNWKRTSNDQAKKTYPQQSRQLSDETSSQSLLASEQLSEPSKPPRSNSNIGTSAKISHRMRGRDRRTRSPPSALSPAPPPPPPSSVFAKSTSESGFRERSSKCLSQQVRNSTLQPLLCRNKIASLGTQWRTMAKAFRLSEEDHKILLLLERKALEKRAAEMSAEAARILWEREEEQRIKRQEWEKERKKMEIVERRHEDKAETKRRLAVLERNFNRAQRRLEETLKRRDEEAQQRLRRIALQKESIRAEKKVADVARQAAVEKRLKHLNQELARYQNLQAEELEARMRQAERQRDWCSGSAIGETTSTSLLVLSSSPKRPSSAPGPTSVTSDPRIASARMIRDAIERNLAASRARSVVLSEAAVRAAASRASATIKARSARARITFTRRRAAHLAKTARLRAVRGAAVARLRSRIRAGERKIAALVAAKERSVASSRAVAAVAAQLRLNLRGTLSPTTFDRMAAEVQHLLRIPSSRSSRLLTPDHQSHIKLG